MRLIEKIELKQEITIDDIKEENSFESKDNIIYILKKHNRELEYDCSKINNFLFSYRIYFARYFTLRIKTYTGFI